MKKKSGLLLTILSVLLFFPLAIHAANVMLMLNPVRVLFVDRHRSVKLSVGNPNDVTVPYKVSLVTMRRGVDGKLYRPEKETEEELFVKKMIRFSPRRAIIAPKERQVLKLMVRKPADLPDGEYQTRVQIIPLENQGKSEQEEQSQEGKKFEIDMIVGVTIPVIIQHGDVHSKIEPISFVFQELSEVPSGLAASVKLKRIGNCSAFGDVVIYFSPDPSKSEIKEIGRGRQVAIYVQEDMRNVVIPLENISKEELSSGSLRVEFHPVIPGQRKVSSRKKESISFKEFSLGPAS